MDQYRTYKDIICIDLKSFYASVECALRGLDPFKTPLVVADEGRGGGSIILAVTPFLKAQGIPGRLRLFELPKDIPGLIVAQPRMRTYLEYSAEIIRIYLSYVAKEDLHIYSIDEVFLDVTPYKALYQKTPRALAADILADIFKQTQIPATAGIGDTLLLAKVALDIESKTAQEGIAEWRYHDVETKLWPIRPLTKFWGIGHRMEKRLNEMGFFTIGDIAQADRDLLHRVFGILGDELYFHTHGIDRSVIAEKRFDVSPMRSVGEGQTLFKDTSLKALLAILFEMADTTAARLRYIGKEAQTVHLAIGYSKAYGGGFSRQIRLTTPTRDPKVIFAWAVDLLDRFAEDLPVRRVSLRLTGLNAYSPVDQLSFFQDRKDKRTEEQFLEALDQIAQRFGKQYALRLSSYLDEGTLKSRLGLVGGHHG